MIKIAVLVQTNCN